MFKNGVVIIREYAIEVWEKLSDMTSNDLIVYDNPKEKEAVMCALQFVRCLEKENNGLFPYIPYRIKTLVLENVNILKKMGKREPFLYDVAMLLSLVNLKSNIYEDSEVQFSTFVNFKTFETTKKEHFIPYNNKIMKESYFGDNSIPNKKRNIWGKKR